MNTMTLAKKATASTKDKLLYVQKEISKRTEELEEAFQRNNLYKLRLLTETSKEQKKMYRDFIKNSNICIKDLNNNIKRKVREEKNLKKEIEKEERVYRDINPIVLKKDDKFTIKIGKLRGAQLKICNIENRINNFVSKYDSILYATVNEDELINKNEVVDLLKRQMSIKYLSNFKEKVTYLLKEQKQKNNLTGLHYKYCWNDIIDIELYPYFKTLIEKKIIGRWNQQYKKFFVKQLNTDIYYIIMSYLIPITFKKNVILTQVYDDIQFNEPLLVEIL